MASRIALRRYAVSRSPPIGQAPTSVCHSRYSVSGSGDRPPLARRRRLVPARRPAAAHSCGDLGEHGQPGPHVLLALGVVGGQRGHGGRPVPGEPAGERVELRRADRRSGPGRRRPRSARPAAASGRTRCPPRPWPSPGRRSAGTARSAGLRRCRPRRGRAPGRRRRRARRAAARAAARRAGAAARGHDRRRPRRAAGSPGTT